MIATLFPITHCADFTAAYVASAKILGIYETTSSAQTSQWIVISSVTLSTRLSLIA